MDAKAKLWELVAAHRAWFEDQYRWNEGELEEDHPERVLLEGVLDLLDEDAERLDPRSPRP